MGDLNVGFIIKKINVIVLTYNICYLFCSQLYIKAKII